MRKSEPAGTSSKKRADDEAKTRRGATLEAAAKKTAAKKPAAKAAKAVAPKKAAAKKPAAKPAAVAKKPAAKKPAAKKAAVAKKPAAKKAAPPKVAVAKKTAAKKAAPPKGALAKKPAAKTPAAKTPAAKKPVAKKAVAKKPVAKKVAVAKAPAAKKVAPPKVAKPAKKVAPKAQLELPIAAPPVRAETPLEALTRAAGAGDRAAAAKLGDAYYAGRGVAHDVGEAARWWTRASALGDLAAKESLAHLYSEGEGPVAQDLDRALVLYRDCAAAGVDVGELVGWLEGRIAARDAAEPEAPLPRDEGEAVAVLARRAGLDRVAERVSALRRSSVRLAPTGAAPRAGACKLGGAPDLPAGAAWPAGPKHAALSFVAQLDCAEVWPFDLEERLPSEGHLAFFVDAKAPRTRGALEARACAVLFHAPGELAPVRGAGAAFDERALAASSEPTLPYAGAEGVRALGLDEDEAEGYQALRDELLGALWAVPGAPIARSLGHADATPTAAAPTAAFEEATTGATLLLEVDARALGEDTGRLAFFLRDDDLAARRFDAAYARLVR